MPPSVPSSSREISGRAGFWFYALHLLTLWGIAASNAFLGLMILWSGRHHRRLEWRWSRHRAVFAPALAYVAVLFVSTAFSFDSAVSSEHLREIFSLTTLFLGAVLVRGERSVRRIFDLLIPLVAIFALYGIVQYYFTDYGDLHRRIRGPFSHYQTFAGVLLIGDLLLIARIVSGQGWRRLWHWAALALINWTLFLTLTRGPWVALGVTLTAYVLLRARRYFPVYVAIAVVGVTAVAIFVPDSAERLRSINDVRDASTYDRVCMLDAGLHMIAERPFTGLGPGMVKELYPIYRHPTAMRFTVPHLHNTFVQLAAERGLLALAAYLWLMGASLALAWRAYRREGGWRGGRADLYVGVILALLAFNIGGLFEDNWRDTEVQRLALFLLAVPLCLRGESPPDQRGENEPSREEIPS